MTMAQLAPRPIQAGLGERGAPTGEYDACVPIPRLRARAGALLGLPHPSADDPTVAKPTHHDPGHRGAPVVGPGPWRSSPEVRARREEE